MIRGLAWFDTATETFSSYRRDAAEAAFAARRLRRLAVRGSRRLVCGSAPSPAASPSGIRAPGPSGIRAPASKKASPTATSPRSPKTSWAGCGSAPSAAASTCSIAPPRRVTALRRANGVARLAERRPRHGDARRQRRRRVGRHHGRRPQSLRPADAARRSFHHDPGGADHARRPAAS